MGGIEKEIAVNVLVNLLQGNKTGKGGGGGEGALA